MGVDIRGHKRGVCFHANPNSIESFVVLED